MIKINIMKKRNEWVLPSAIFFVQTNKKKKKLRRNIYVIRIIRCSILRYSEKFLENCEEHLYGKELRDDSLVGNV